MANTVQTHIKVNGSDAIAQFNNLGKSIRNNMIAGQLMGTAITSAMGAAQAAVSGFTDALGTAINIQQDNISIAGDLSKITNLNFDQASESVERFSAEMATIAGALPGTTQDFVDVGKALMDEVAEPFTNLEGILDQGGFEKKLKELSTGVGLYTAKIGMSAEQAGSQVSKFLGGNATFTELKQLDFFQNNKAVSKIIGDYLKEEGKDLKELTSKERLDLLSKAVEVSAETIEASKNSVSGLMEGFKSSLFDPSTGIFGMMRDFDPDTEGSQSAFSSFQKVMASLLGETGTIAKGAAILQGLGLDGDPMQALASGFDWIDSRIKSFNTFLNSIRAKLDTGRELALDFNIGEFLAKQANKFMGLFDSIDIDRVGLLIGAGIGFAVNNLVAYLKALDLFAAAALFGKVLLIGITALGASLAAIEWWEVGIVLLKAGGVAIAALAATTIASIAGLTAPIALAIVGITAFAVGVVIEIKEYWAAQGAEIKASVSALANAISSVFTAIRDRITGMLGEVLKGDTTSPRGFSGRGRYGRTPNAATGLNVGGLLAAVGRERRAMPTGAVPVIANSSEVILNRAQASQFASGSSLQIGNITINSGASSDPRKLANEVIREIDRQYRSYSQSRLSPSYG